MSQQWHYSQDGAQYGPVDEAEIVRLIQDGELPPSTPVCKEGGMDWQPARNHACFQVEIFPKKKHSPKDKKKRPDLSIDPDFEAELLKAAGATQSSSVTPASDATSAGSSKPSKKPVAQLAKTGLNAPAQPLYPYESVEGPAESEGLSAGFKIIVVAGLAIVILVIWVMAGNGEDAESMAAVPKAPKKKTNGPEINLPVPLKTPLVPPIVAPRPSPTAGGTVSPKGLIFPDPAIYPNAPVTVEILRIISGDEAAPLTGRRDPARIIKNGKFPFLFEVKITNHRLTKVITYSSDFELEDDDNLTYDSQSSLNRIPRVDLRRGKSARGMVMFEAYAGAKPKFLKWKGTGGVIVSPDLRRFLP